MSRLIKMAIKDIPKGEPISGNAHGPRWRYDHVLDPKHVKAGYECHVQEYTHPDKQNVVTAKVYHNKQVVGELDGSLAHVNNAIKPDFARISSDSDPDGKRKHRGKGLGKAMYEALFTHAMHHHGCERVIGGEHSTAAHHVHAALAAKHGMNYKAQPNTEDNEGYGAAYADQEEWENSRDKDFDSKWGSYHYAMKSDLTKVEGPVKRGQVVYEKYPDVPANGPPKKFIVKLPESQYLHVKPHGRPGAITDVVERDEMTADPAHIMGAKPKPPVDSDPRKFRTADLGKPVFDVPRTPNTGERVRPRDYKIDQVDPRAVAAHKVAVGENIVARVAPINNARHGWNFPFNQNKLTRNRPATRVGRPIPADAKKVRGTNNPYPDYPGESHWYPHHVEPELINHFNSHTPDQKDALDFLKNRGGWNIDELKSAGLGGAYSQNSHSGIIKDSLGINKLLVKIHGGGNWAGRDNFDNDFSTAQREVLYHNLAHGYFGLGTHVPATVLLDSPTGTPGHHYSAQVWHHGQRTSDKFPDHELVSTLKQHHDDHALPKLTLMNYVMGNTDRHQGNWMAPKTAGTGPIQLIDNGLVMPKKNNKRIYLPDYAFKAYGHPKFREQRPMLPETYEDFHPEVKAWANKLDPKTLADHLEKHGAGSYIPSVITRLHHMKAMVNAKEGDTLLGLWKPTIHRKLGAMFQGD